MFNDFSIKFTLHSAFEAISWFKEKIKSLLNPDVNKKQELKEKSKEILDNDERVDKFEVGKMYLFHYDPKWKNVLPYYDTFPLILMMGNANKGFYGINLHYLPTNLRMLLLSNLLEKSVYKNNELERLRISYDILKNVSTLQPFKPCFKQYLYKHIKGSIKLIPPSDWGYAVALPLEDFKKKTKQEVWKESVDSLNLG